ncbi:hypothetical protein [Roseateles sp.]|uniref:hypothetical protein n=1 Tax=Roseateles sp. TaxID=1971397 RepID=UPI0025CF528D|nr:hypothetical protein [Roseateles sp.]MBV8034207.1 hypothetical protein [Roseateles sp.]
MNGRRPPSLRDDLLLAAAAVGATAVLFLPGAWLVAERVSPELLLFSLLQPLNWAAIVLAQVAALRLADRHLARPGVPGQFCIAAPVGMAVAAGLCAWVDPPAVRLGLLGETGNTRLLGAWTAALIAAFMVWSREAWTRHAASVERLRRVQQAQLSARREAVDAQLRAMQARIDAQQFFKALDAIERLYGSDAGRADALFDALVLYLRAAVPSLDGGASTLGRELALAAACVRMHALATGRDVALEIDVAAPLRLLAFPPGVLLPLLGGALAAGQNAGPLAVVARPAGARALTLTLRAPPGPDEAGLRQAGRALAALYGAAATLRREAGLTLVHLELPHGSR